MVPHPIQFFSAQSAGVQTALVAAGASLAASALTLAGTVFNTPFKYWLDNRALDVKLRTEYRYKNLTELQDLTKRYKGLLVETAEALNHRFFNLYNYEADAWLFVGGDFSNSGYYFKSWVRRLVKLIAIATAFENESLYIDQSIASDADFEFAYLIKSWLYVLSNLNLFDNLPHINDRQRDHLYKDTIRCIGESAWKEDHFVSDNELNQMLETDENVNTLCRFLDGLNAAEDRLRWDRMVCLHLLVLLFLNRFGYSIHQTDSTKLDKVISKIQHPQIKANLIDLLGRWKLDQVANRSHLIDLLANTPA